MQKWLLIIVFTWGGFTLSAQEKDTTIILLSDMNLQIEIAQGLNDMYNFKFDKAASQYFYLKKKYAWHPLPYFLLGLNEWWKIMPNLSNKEHDDTFLAYMDTVVMVSEKLYELPQHRIEASFFLSASYGFMGRLYSDEDRKNWRKATVVGRNALNYMEESKGKPDLSPELLFGDALYNYFSMWIPENYPILRPVMMLFPKGDKELGIKQLREVSFNAFYTRTEAMVWLMRILHSYENDPRGAFYIGEYLHTTYPDNPYFHRYYARLLYSSGRYTEALEVSEQILHHIDSGKVGYEATSGRYAAFFLGHISQMKQKNAEAKYYYSRAIAFAESIGADDTGYYYYSILNTGEILEREGKVDEAKEYYKRVKKEASRSDSAHKAAKQKLKEL